MFRRLASAAWLVGSLVATFSTTSTLRAQLELSGPEQTVPPLPSAADSFDAPDLPDGAEVMVTGPLHEAFAEQFTDQPEPGIVISKRPPEAIDELPPEYRTDGEDVVWIPGYWGWDPEREDFLWITGIWRQAPPDRKWVPGYWAEVPEGFQWIAGFWALNNVGEIRYLPLPPEPLAADPSSPAPSQDHFWIQGQWTYVNNDYQWRAGYWTMGYQDWVWVPDRYVWTPSGCIYRTGYWDYVVPERGTVFCPVYWSQPVAGYRFRPSYVVNTGPTLLANLFVYPRYHHYFFGNYYSSRYLGQSIYPWVTYGQQSRRHDPLYGYYRTQYRDNDYLNRLTRLHNYYAANVSYQPPRTLQAQRAHQHDFHDRQDLQFHAMQLNQLVNVPQHDHHDHMQLVKLADNERQRIQNNLNPAKEMWKQRAQFEGKQLADNKANGRDGFNKPGAKLGSGEVPRWNLPTNSNGTRLGSVSIGDPRRIPGDNDGRQRNDDRSSSRDGGLKGDVNRDGVIDIRDRVGNNLDPRDRNPRDNAKGDTNPNKLERDKLDREKMDREERDRNALARENQNRDPNNRVPLNRDPLNQNGNARDAQGRDALNRNPLTKDGKPNPLNRDPLNRDPLNRDPLNRDPLNRDPLNRDPLNRDPLNRDAGQRDKQPDMQPKDNRQPKGRQNVPGVPNTGVPNTGSPNTGVPNTGVPNNRPSPRDIKPNLPGRSVENYNKTPNETLTNPKPSNPGLNNQNNPRERAPRINPPQLNTQPNIAPGEPKPGAPRRGNSPLPSNIQSDMQKMREMSQQRSAQRRETNNAPRRAPQPPAGAKNEKGKDKP